jgi:Predicted glycosyltransferases
MNPAPIVIFTYNRPIHTKETIEALQKNNYAEESDLIVFSDAPKNEDAQKGVADTRSYLRTVSGFKSVRIIERETNRGLADNIIDGVTSVVNEQGKIIVLEDDLLTSPYFLTFMNQALEKYENEEKVISVHGYVYPLNKKLPESFFIRGADCLGWGTWKRAWDLFVEDGQSLLNEIKEKRLSKEFDFSGSYPYTKMLEKQAKGTIGSWAVRWYASAFLNNKLTLYPGRSLIFHNGSDGSGTNCDENDELSVELSTTSILLEEIMIEENKDARDAFICFFRYTRLKRLITARLKKLFKTK